jgi:hypothetical protein
MEQIGGTPIEICFCSLLQLLSELKLPAADLRIPVINGDPTDETAAAINGWLPQYEGDSTELSETNALHGYADDDSARTISGQRKSLLI